MPFEPTSISNNYRLATQAFLSTDEQHILIAALLAVSPSGGKSDAFRLSEKLSEALGVDTHCDAVNRVYTKLSYSAYTEVCEYLEQTPLPLP